MLLAVDVGNTNIGFALCNGDVILHQWRLATDIHKTKDEYAVWLFNALQLADIDPKSVSDVVVSSVVPDINFAMKHVFQDYWKLDPYFITSGNVPCDMKVEIDRPEELGADRLINAYAAWSQLQHAVIIVDFGTATTFDAISADGAYVGGAIAPGVNLSLEALKRSASKLHGISIAPIDHVIGKSTTDAMTSGIYYGYIGLIEGIVSRMKTELGAKKIKVIATGGLANLYAHASELIDSVDENLTITGLRLMYQTRAKNTQPIAKNA